MTRQRSTAHHEAGYAIIGRVLGLPCGQASIVEDYEDLTGGHSMTNGGLVRRHCRSIERVAKALLEHETFQDDKIHELINGTTDD